MHNWRPQLIMNNKQTEYSVRSVNEITELSASRLKKGSVISSTNAARTPENPATGLQTLAEGPGTDTPYVSATHDSDVKLSKNKKKKLKRKYVTELLLEHTDLEPDYTEGPSRIMPLPSILPQPYIQTTYEKTIVLKPQAPTVDLSTATAGTIGSTEERRPRKNRLSRKKRAQIAIARLALAHEEPLTQMTLNNIGNIHRPATCPELGMGVTRSDHQLSEKSDHQLAEESDHQLAEHSDRQLAEHSYHQLAEHSYHQLAEKSDHQLAEHSDHQLAEEQMNLACETATPLADPADPDRVFQGWNNDLQELRRKTRQLFNRARNTGREKDWENYKAAQREYKKQVRIRQRHSIFVYQETEELLKSLAQ